MRILMFTWEFPPLISGGLGIACYGIVNALLKRGHQIYLVLPTKEEVFFPLTEIEDVDKLPVQFLNHQKNVEYLRKVFKKEEERFDYIGMTRFPESYFSIEDNKFFLLRSKILFETSYEEILIKQINYGQLSENNLFRKVAEFTGRAQRYAKTIEHDIIHVHDWLTYPAGIIAKKVSRKPLITHIHATEFDRTGGIGDERIHKIEYAGMQLADSVIAVSKYTSEMVIDRYRIDTKKVHIVHNAIMKRKIKHEKDRIFKGPTIIFLGRITIQKGPDYFLKAASIVLKKHPESRFIMAGSGDMERKMLYQSARGRLLHKFLFTGFLNRDEVNKIFSASDIYVLSSVSEPFGIAPLEAMSFGIASIISKQSGVSEIVKNALKVDFWDVNKLAESINFLIENPEERKELGLKGKREVEKIAWDSAALKIEEIYRRLL